METFSRENLYVYELTDVQAPVTEKMGLISLFLAILQERNYRFFRRTLVKRPNLKNSANVFISANIQLTSSNLPLICKIIAEVCACIIEALKEHVLEISIQHSKYFIEYLEY
nr:unnamed protein product [Callosobruchus chinensis]